MTDLFYGSEDVADEIGLRLDAMATDLDHFSGAILHLISMPKEVEERLAPTVYRLAIEAKKIRELYREKEEK